MTNKQTLSKNTSASPRYLSPPYFWSPVSLQQDTFGPIGEDSQCRSLGSVHCCSFSFCATCFLLSYSSMGSSTGHRTFGVIPLPGSPLSPISSSLLQVFFVWLFALAPAQTATCFSTTLASLLVHPFCPVLFCPSPLPCLLPFLQHPSCLAVSYVSQWLPPLKYGVK